MTFARFSVAAALLFALPSIAQTEGAGRISITPGWRWTPNDHLQQSASALGHAFERASPGGPQLTASFAYAASAAIEVDIDLFIGTETLKLSGTDPIQSTSYGALVGARYFWDLRPLVPYIGLSLGPTLVYASRGLETATSTERVTTGYAAVGGVHWLFSDTLALTFDVRALYARGLVSGVGGVNGGGAWAGVGLTWLFAPEPTRSAAGL